MGEPLHVIAIDGPAGAGKSTVAREAAREIGYRFFDTGLLYRALTSRAIQLGIDPADAEELTRLADELEIRVDEDGSIAVGNEINSEDLRSAKVDDQVSQVAAHPTVRKALVKLQRRIASDAPVIIVGRDITTVVAPDAGVRLYVDAEPSVRALRRWAELHAKGIETSFADVLADIDTRDRKDRNRESAPLKWDAAVTAIDTTDMSIDQVVDAIVDIVEETWPREQVEMSNAHSQGKSYSGRRQVAQTLSWPWLRRVLRVSEVDKEFVPLEGPLLFVSNHLHNADPMIEFFSFPRELNFMGKKELFAWPVIRQLALVSGGFPVDRGKVDREALKQAEARLAHGVTVGMYPEGGRSPTGALIEGKAGAGLLALRASAPIQPVAITGSERLPVNGSKGKAQAASVSRDAGHSGIRIRYGRPFTIPRTLDGRKIGAQEATEIIMLEIARLLPESYQGVYTEMLEQEEKRRIVPYPASSDSSASGP